MSTSLIARILVHILALLVLTHAATLVASPPTDNDWVYAWLVGPWEQITNLLWVAVLLQVVAIVVVVLRFPGDRRPLRVGLLIVGAIIATTVNAVVLSLIAALTDTSSSGIDSFGIALFVTGLAGMVFVVAAALAAALAEYALLPTPRSTVAT